MRFAIFVRCDVRKLSLMTLVNVGKAPGMDQKHLQLVERIWSAPGVYEAIQVEL
jgi:hypothetical protein